MIFKKNTALGDLVLENEGCFYKIDLKCNCKMSIDNAMRLLFKLKEFKPINFILTIKDIKQVEPGYVERYEDYLPEDKVPLNDYGEGTIEANTIEDIYWLLYDFCDYDDEYCVSEFYIVFQV